MNIGDNAKLQFVRSHGVTCVDAGIIDQWDLSQHLRWQLRGIWACHIKYWSHV